MTKAEAKAKIEEARRTLELLAPEFDEAEPCSIVFEELAAHAIDLLADVANGFPEPEPTPRTYLGEIDTNLGRAVVFVRL
jgi:hypothetical protein